MRLVISAVTVLAVACSPVVEPSQVSGEAIAFGAGPSGARNACFTCHGLDGEGRGAIPRLAGLDAGYLTKQLFDYASGQRSDRVMGPIARAMSDHDKRLVANYYAARAPIPELNSAAPGLYARGDPGRALRACAECHGVAAQGIGAANPALAGQPAQYTSDQLRLWKRGGRRNDPGNVMSAISRALTEEEIETIAAYLAQPRARE